MDRRIHVGEEESTLGIEEFTLGIEESTLEILDQSIFVEEEEDEQETSSLEIVFLKYRVQALTDEEYKKII